MALRRENSPAEIRGSVSRRRNANFDLRRRVLCGLVQGKQSDRVFRAGETQILNCRDAFFVALRRRNANFDLRRRIFCPDEVDSRGVTTGWTKSPRRYSETRKKFPSHGFAQAKRKFWPPESRFLWPCAVKNEERKKKHLDLRGFTLTVRTPQCDTLFGDNPDSICPTKVTRAHCAHFRADGGDAPANRRTHFVAGGKHDHNGQRVPVNRQGSPPPQRPSQSPAQGNVERLRASTRVLRCALQWVARVTWYMYDSLWAVPGEAGSRKSGKPRWNSQAALRCFARRDPAQARRGPKIFFCKSNFRRVEKDKRKRGERERERERDWGIKRSGSQHHSNFLKRPKHVWKVQSLESL